METPLFDLPPVTLREAVVIGTLLLVLGFALWAYRRRADGSALSFSENGLLNAVGWAAVLLALPGAALFVVTLFSLAQLTLSFPLDGGGAALRRHATLLLSLLAAIGALVGLVFGVIRVFAVERQTKAQELANALEQESLFNDKMSAATGDLYARRQSEDGAWEDDVPRRNSAIDRLEALVHERPREAARVARLLSVYVRELSKENPPKSHDYQGVWDLMHPQGETPPRKEDDALFELDLHPDAANINAMRGWTDKLEPRSDMENAVQSLGRLRGKRGVIAGAVKIDLRGANLQGMDLQNLDMRRADLARANCVGIDAENSDFSHAYLSKAQFHCSHLEGASFAECNAHMVRMDGVYLSDTSFVGCDLWEAVFDGCEWSFNDHWRGANLAGASAERVLAQDYTRDECIGDGRTVLLSNRANRWSEIPSHWLTGEHMTARDAHRSWQSWLRANHPDLAD